MSSSVAFARSPEIASGPVIRVLSWALFPDVLFSAVAFLLFAFLLRAIWLTFFQKTMDTLSAA
ncbi:MAG: hypothetical protein MIO92_05740 [Methanosarcinaceae archaeon]|nr:hypothetical protein [Methanosarcinaceae archaeon]